MLAPSPLPAAPDFAIGSLVRARGRDWVVLPGSSRDILELQPLGGAPEDALGLYLPLESEPVVPASFALPDPRKMGDARASRLLREAARLGFRSGAGPFRSFGAIAVAPRPYQLVPLLLALQLDPVRLLIADDVGVGKTIEAGLIARELLDRGDIRSFAVLCPPHLAEQWVAELREKFGLEAVLVLAATAGRLERGCSVGESLFDSNPITVVSLDFIKTERRRAEFLRACPDLVIVDEAHACAQSGAGARQQRHKLLRELAKKPTQHLVLVSATPHSGNADAFRSLLGLLQPQFEHLPDDLSGESNAPLRRELARHLVQRRRADVLHYGSADTPFPGREEKEVGYALSPEYKRFFERVLAYARESVKDTSGGHFRQRVRWWAALGLLRALASSPAAAAATLKARARNADALSPNEADEIGAMQIFDLEDESAQASDVAPGALSEDEDGEGNGGGSGSGTQPSQKRRLLELANIAEGLKGAPDEKLARATKITKELLDDNYNPILFCRFIDTAQAVGEHLRTKLKGVEVEIVTGLQSPEDRKAAVVELAARTEEGKRRVLVATDCLSEGINLQAYFDAIVHYDLAWNPTRHEQREGRVDRFGQPSKTIRVVTLYGTDNQIDGLILDVLIRKGKKIRQSLGVSVPVPKDAEKVAEAIFEGLLLRGVKDFSVDQLSLFEDIKQKKDALHADWDAAQAREKRSRTLFAQDGIKPDEVAREVEAMTKALGGAREVESFVRDAMRALDLPLAPGPLVVVEPAKMPEAIGEPLRAALAPKEFQKGVRGRFDTANAAGEVLLGRTHPVVSGLASYVLECALDELHQNPIAARCGAMRTQSVEKRTTLLLVRMRFHIHQKPKNSVAERALLAEDCALLAFRGAPQDAQWLSSEEAEKLLDAVPAANVPNDLAANMIENITRDFDHLAPALDQAARERAAELLESHRRARDAAKSGGTVRVEAQLPPDVLGLWVFVPPVQTS
ncbi:MAG: DEAD/DEAH box helicase [Armatimonadetes bacterium]|nr:DEAD/DEAH box helicase [Armatimonadota bacterium]